MSIEAMKQALEALEFSETEPHRPQYEVEASAMRALRTAIQQAEARTGEPVPVFLVRDVASLLGASVPGVCDALAELGYEPRRSTNAAISPDEAIAVAKRINPAPGVPDGWVVVKRNAIESALQHVPYRGETWSALNSAMLAASPVQKGGE